MLNEKEKQVVQFVIGQVFSNKKLSHPRYYHELENEAHADRLSDVLPLIYVSNENRELGSFTVSINGSVLGYLLEALVPRSYPHLSELEMNPYR